MTKLVHFFIRYYLLALLLVLVRLYCQKMLDLKIKRRVNLKFL